METIILASASPRRIKLLEQLDFKFEVIPSNASETFPSNAQPADIVQMLSLRKAKSVTQLQKRKDDFLVIGADTLVVFEDNILEKPNNKNHAASMIATLSGKAHEVLTGVALIKADNDNNILDEYTFFEMTTVQFSKLKEDEIQTYIEKEQPLDKAGSYGIQDNWSALFVEGIKGDYNNVVGFPLHAFYKRMRSFAPEYLPLKFL